MTGQRQARHLPLAPTLAIVMALALLAALPIWLFGGPPASVPIVLPAGEARAGTVAAVRCPFRQAAGQVRCVRAYVPQDHDDPVSPVISIFATIVEPEGGATRADPFLYLEGGPGYAASWETWTEYMDGGAAAFFEEVLATGRAVILVDTRGLGRAEPALRCPAYDETVWGEMRRRPDRRDPSRELAALEACVDAYEREGVDVSQYTSRQLGRDLKMLREGLGVEQWNAYGVSYGAQSLLALMEADRAGVRTAVFDSPSYGRLDFLPGDQAAFERALGLVQEKCDELVPKSENGEIYFMYEKTCEGGVGERLASLLERLDEMPLTLRNQPLAKPVYLTSREAVSLFHENLYFGDGWWDFLSQLEEMEAERPSYFSSLSQENIDWYNRLVYANLDETFSYPVYLATTCTESDTQTLAAPSRWPLYTPQEAEEQRAGCEIVEAYWDGGRLDGADYAGVPAMVFSGWRDVITPPAYGAELAADLGARYVLSIDESHGTVFWSVTLCELQTMLAFLEAPGDVAIDREACGELCRAEPSGEIPDDLGYVPDVLCRSAIIEPSDRNTFDVESF